MPAVPSSIIEPIWDQLSALLPASEDAHPLGCHRPRIPDRVAFDTLVQVLVFGCASHRIADATCSATTRRRRRDTWIASGVVDTLRDVVLGAYDRMIGLSVADVSLDWCITLGGGFSLLSRQGHPQGCGVECLDQLDLSLCWSFWTGLLSLVGII